MPFRSDFWVLYYNKDLFDKAGVEYPSNDLTMEDYDALARKMTSGSGDTKVYGCHYHTWRSAASLFSILDGKNTIIDGKYDFMKPTYDMVIAQQKDGICMDYGYLKTSSLHYSAAFENQQCAMVNMGSWFISTLEAYMKDAETKFNWGIVKYPHPAGAEAGSTLGTVTSLAINADSPKQRPLPTSSTGVSLKRAHRPLPRPAPSRPAAPLLPPRSSSPPKASPRTATLWMH